MKTVRDLLAKLKQSREADASLLDRTTVFLGSNLGDGSSHPVKNLPVLLAGGGFRTASTCPSIRQPATALQPLRQHAAAHRHRSRQVRHQHRYVDRLGCRELLAQKVSQRGSRATLTSYNARFASPFVSLPVAPRASRMSHSISRRRLLQAAAAAAAVAANHSALRHPGRAIAQSRNCRLRALAWAARCAVT